ncbi:MAG: TOBE domain-containing protein [Promethearchaeia archaeon]
MSKEPLKSSGRNTMHGEIEEIFHRGATVNLKVLDTGEDVVATITEASLSDLEYRSWNRSLTDVQGNFSSFYMKNRLLFLKKIFLFLLY